MTNQQFRMLDKAAIRHNAPILPISNKLFFKDCFTAHKNKLIFWYNVIGDDGREYSHSIVEEIENA